MVFSALVPPALNAACPPVSVPSCLVSQRPHGLSLTCHGGKYDSGARGAPVLKCDNENAGASSLALKARRAPRGFRRCVAPEIPCYRPGHLNDFFTPRLCVLLTFVIHVTLPLSLAFWIGYPRVAFKFIY